MSNKPVLMLAVFIGACDIITRSITAIPLATVGINIAELEKVQSDEHWISTDRTNVCRVFQALRDGMSAQLGFDPYLIPSEYLAALIVCYCKPINYHAACAWLSGISRSTSDLADNKDAASEAVKPSNLFALILLASANDPKFASRFHSRINNAVDMSEQDQGSLGEGKGGKDKKKS